MGIWHTVCVLSMKYRNLALPEADKKLTKSVRFLIQSHCSVFVHRLHWIESAVKQIRSVCPRGRDRYKLKKADAAYYALAINASSFRCHILKQIWNKYRTDMISVFGTNMVQIWNKYDQCRSLLNKYDWRKWKKYETNIEQIRSA